jgi:hypothetical protein
MNSGAGAFGPGNRANGSIGRALRLVMMNVGGALPGSTDRATQGTPAKWSWCFAENDAGSPWEPYHVAVCGLDADDSAVTVAAVEGPHNINDHNSVSGEEILFTIAETMATPGANTIYRGGDHFVVLGPEHAGGHRRSGFSRADAQAYLYEHARVPIDRIGARKLEKPAAGAATRPKSRAGRPHPDRARAEEIRILVAGGRQTLGVDSDLRTDPQPDEGVAVPARAGQLAPIAVSAAVAASSDRKRTASVVILIGGGPLPTPLRSTRRARSSRRWWSKAFGPAVCSRKRPTSRTSRATRRACSGRSSPATCAIRPSASAPASSAKTSRRRRSRPSAAASTGSASASAGCARRP